MKFALGGIVLVFTFLAAANGCSKPGPTVTPIPTRNYLYTEGPAPTLVIFLPGIHDTSDDFEKYGFIEEVRKRGLPFDLVSVDAHFGYYENGTLVERLHLDVIKPAQRHAYEQIVLTGISLGGFGSLAYARNHHNEVHKILLLSPYLGTPELIQTIIDAGGLERWEYRLFEQKRDERNIWLWLKNNPPRLPGIPSLFLGYGHEDRYLQSQRLLSSILPNERVLVTKGGHNWNTWRRLWEDALDRRIFSSPPHQTMAKPKSLTPSDPSTDPRKTLLTANHM